MKIPRKVWKEVEEDLRKYHKPGMKNENVMAFMREVFGRYDGENNK